jgi:hypothetical protein
MVTLSRRDNRVKAAPSFSGWLFSAADTIAQWGDEPSQWLAARVRELGALARDWQCDSAAGLDTIELRLERELNLELARERALRADAERALDDILSGGCRLP